ncbi:hypothetical protein CHH28_00925 [Bacterioplanes sanyensis]|uniref:Energy-coupling factor ABC transporter permease n=1 Tax=Bacterioplanes sanyensis TaxID=1249553 RepID=A0A222FFZ1_9GAMM|nr:energy-coupling factor ABC transporter permease [Bacterioplanes sanyensis]ASP37331.1 hypothetical protein CHH28_00925 [Bacterioplanes sanyensis]
MTTWYDALPGWLLILCAVLSVPILVWALRGSNWQAMQQHWMAQHLFAGSVLVMSLMWTGSAGVLPGLEFYLLGYTAVVLMMGIRLALVAALLAQGFSLLMQAWIEGEWVWQLLGYRYLLQTAIPMLFVYGFYRWVYLRLAHNPFVYMLVAGFLNAGFTHAVADILHSLILWSCDLYSWGDIWHNYLRYLPLMMFPEGVINGMFIAGMVAFHPLWLSTFDEDSYFH